ncbi:SCP-like protein [Ancylostoma ceylanicum]|uniref:SCP-like protein n=1 Tax=Ancylostoma ceylanicum TaxID=53326 RepID=A0A0D6LM88_9BILA|nr:SCP-like protein [Ancylostoma ceylanicum]
MTRGGSLGDPRTAQDVTRLGQKQNFQCWNFKSTDTLREQYLRSINKLRRQIADGSAVNNNQTKCPQGQNVYRLSWDCELELKAQEAVDQCKTSGVPEPAGHSQLIKRVASTCTPTKILKNSISEWWNDDVQKVGVDNPPLNKQGLEQFAKLANGRATKIGCAQKNCNEQLYVACVVNEPAPAPDALIYEPGLGCNCTSFLDSKCNANKTYDCPAEASAHSSATRCRNAADSSGNYDENFYFINSNTIEHKTAAREAANTWGLEISTRTMPQRDTERNMYSSSLGIPNFANMVWEAHSGVGCAIVRCNSRTNVVCHYSPKSIGDNRQIYKMGPACRRCHDYPGTRCVDGLCTV